jgi:hypothetical protein
MIGTIRKILRNTYGPSIFEDVEELSKYYLDNIKNKRYNFDSYSKKTITRNSSNGRKKRTVFFFEKNTTEYILCKYLKDRLDRTFEISYSDRKKLIKILFNTLPILNDLNDFVIVRFDFKTFFDSVLTEFIYNKYIENSSMRRADKDLFVQFCDSFKHCYAGLQTSNAMTELACKDFDKVFRSKLKDYGVVYFERYVDDVLIILNSFISEDEFRTLLRNSIAKAFGECDIKLNEDKFIYVSRRNILPSIDFDFLGYLFHIRMDFKKLDFTYGIKDNKRNKYIAKIRETLIDYKKRGNLEVLRHKIKLFSVRIVYSVLRENDYCFWVTKGLINNYGELRFHLDKLDVETEKFLKNIYFDEMKKLKMKIPYFMHYNNENSIYNLFSNMKRYRSIVFDRKIGVKIKDLINVVGKINPGYYAGKKEYYQIVNDYFEFLKIKRHRSYTPMPGRNVQPNCNPALITCADSLEIQEQSDNFDDSIQERECQYEN